LYNPNSKLDLEGAWSNIRDEIKKEITPFGYTMQLKKELNNMKIDGTKTFSNQINKYVEIIEELEEMKEEQNNRKWAETFIELLPRDSQIMLYLIQLQGKFENLQQVSDKLKQLDEQNFEKLSINEFMKTTMKTIPPKKEKEKERGKEIGEERVCFICQGNHIAKRCPNREKKTGLVCQYCPKFDNHTTEECSNSVAKAKYFQEIEFKSKEKSIQDLKKLTEMPIQKEYKKIGNAALETKLKINTSGQPAVPLVAAPVRVIRMMTTTPPEDEEQ
jgi:hypothetical protein